MHTLYFVSTKGFGLTALRPVMLSREDKEEFGKLSESIKIDLSTQNEIENAMAERIVLCLWKLRCGMNAEAEIIKSYTNFDGIDWAGLLKSGYLWKISRYERRIINYLNRMLKGLKDRSNTKDFSGITG